MTPSALPLPPAPADAAVPAAALTVEEQDTLLVLSFLYLASGDGRRAVVLLLVLERNAPGNPAVLRALAHAYTETGMAGRALDVLDRLAEAGNEADRQGIMLIRSRALLQLGRHAEARQCFRAFVALRGQPAAAGRDGTAPAGPATDAPGLIAPGTAPSGLIPAGALAA